MTGPSGVTYLAISIGAVLGANARFLVTGGLIEGLGAGFPWGTLFVDSSGSFLIGLILGLASERGAGPWWLLPGVAIGFLGSYTTFSAFSYETVRMAAGGDLVAAAVNIIASVGGALLGVFAGALLARALSTGGR